MCQDENHLLTCMHKQRFLSEILCYFLCFPPVFSFVVWFILPVPHHVSYSIYIGRQYIHGKLTSSWKAFGIPLVARLSDSLLGSDIHNLYLKLLNPFQVLAQESLEDSDSPDVISPEDATREDKTLNPEIDGSVEPCSIKGVNSPLDATLQFYLADEKGAIRESEIVMNEPVVVTGTLRRLNLLVSWPEKNIKRYDMQLLSSLPEVFKSVLFAKRPQESVSLYKCLEAFLKEEPLGPEDMWSVCTY